LSLEESATHSTDDQQRSAQGAACHCGKLCFQPGSLEAQMSSSLEMLIAEILRLSPAERARLLDILLASLDADSGAEAEWDAIADERERELDAGLVKAVPLEEVIARLEARYPDEGQASSAG
jgi:hypothetical protein